jgi:kynureninase
MLKELKTIPFEFTKAFALEMDENDPLKGFRQRFAFPKINGKKSLYFTGNSLGLKPIDADKAIKTELDDWANWGVEGHLMAKNPWFSYHELFTENLAELTGAKAHEVVAMNGLTTNLHLLFASFYRPDNKRFKIICEKKAFPSDQYMLESQVIHHGLDPKDCIIEVGPREGEFLIQHEDIYNAIEEHANELALVFFGGVNYYSGQLFDMKTITQHGHDAGALVGFDLAHAFGNVELSLHEWQVDFASWCSYKYLNSGPGSISGVFIHEKHGLDPNTPRLSGWWGYDKKTRFHMDSGFHPIPGAEGWQLSNAPVLAMAVHKVALEIHCEAGMKALRKKSVLLTSYLEFIIQEISHSHPEVSFEIISPKEKEQRGAQLSLLVHGKGKELFHALMKEGAIVDWREPNVIRLAPVPLYNSFSDVFELGELLNKIIS